jgi:hypothetical protein
MNQLDMNSGPSFVKPAIFGVIALAIAGGVFAMTQSGDKKVAAKPDDAQQQQTAMAGDSGVAAPASDIAASKAPDAATPPATETANAQAAATAPTPSASTPADPAMAAAAPAPAIAPAPAEATTAPVAPAPTETAAATAAAPIAKAKAKPVETASNAEPSAAMPAPAPAPAPASDNSAAAPAETKVAVKDEKPNRPAVRKPAPAAADALRPWWGETASDDRFGVQYVGQAAGEPSLVIRFTRQVADPAAAQNIKVIGSNGQPVAANWQAGKDPRVLVAPNLQPGRYTVVIDSQLASTDGQALGTQLNGPTYIQ